MKRRAKASEEWVDLIQAETSDNDNKKGNSSRIGKGRVVGIIAGALVLFLMFTVSQKGSTTQQQQQQHLIVDSSRQGKRRNRKVVLLGPHDRYSDFGDILAERVVTKLLVDRTGFVFSEDDEAANTLLLGGIVTRDDMDHHGLTPRKTVHSMSEIQKLSRADAVMGPYDIVFTGGSGEGPGDEGPAILYEKHRDAVEHLETAALRQKASNDRVWDCPYLFPKELLAPETRINTTKVHDTGRVHTLVRQKKNYAIVDSLETQNQKDRADKAAPMACRRVVTMADHLGYRSSKPFAPDSTVMTKELFGAEIEALFEAEVKRDLLGFPAFAAANGDGTPPLRYIAVQHENAKHEFDPAYAETLAEALDEASVNLGNIPVVFFPAGRVGRPIGDHVAFGLSREVSEKMQQPSVLYEVEHALRVAALIQGAEAVLSTNLHVLILSFVYQKPRVSWDGGRNHELFLDVWEAQDVASLGMLSSVGDTWEKGLRPFFRTDGSGITQGQTESAHQKAKEHYLDNFERWSNLLITPTNKGDDDDGSPTRHRTVLL